VMEAGSQLTIFDASSDTDEMSREWRRGTRLMPIDDRGDVELQVRIEKLFESDPEDLNKEKIFDYSMRYNFLPQIEGRRSDLERSTKVVINGRSMNKGPIKLQVAFITREGNTFGGMVELKPDGGEVVLPFTAMQPVKMVTLPRPYPTFLTYYFNGGSSAPFNVKDIETIQISVGPGLSEQERENPQGFAIRSVILN